MKTQTQMKTQLQRYKKIVAGLALAGSLLALAACGSAAETASAANPTSAANATSAGGGQTAQATGGQTVQQGLKIVTGKMLNKPGWPQYQLASGGSTAAWTIAKAGDTVVLTITSYDDGTAPLPAGSPYAKVSGTVNGTETVDGQVVSSIPVGQVAHTFTIPSLGVNLVIPAAPSGKTVTVQASIKFTKAGTYDWHCMSPCGTGSSGFGGPMVTAGYMEGTLTVQG